jgi:hypothetical protein
MLEEKILKLSKDQRVNLPVIIERAKTQNFPGVKFTSKPAYFFIKDCVDLAEDYIPLVIYNTLTNPIDKLKKIGVTKAEVSEFVNKKTPQSGALLNLMLLDIEKMGIKISTVAVTEVKAEVTEDTSDDVYGVYGMVDTPVDIVFEEEAPAEVKHDVSNSAAIITTLCEVLGAK